MTAAIDYTGAPEAALGFTNEDVENFVPPPMWLDVGATAEELGRAFSTLATDVADDPRPASRPSLIGRLINFIRRKA